MKGVDLSFPYFWAFIYDSLYSICYPTYRCHIIDAQGCIHVKETTDTTDRSELTIPLENSKRLHCNGIVSSLANLYIFDTVRHARYFCNFFYFINHFKEENWINTLEPVVTIAMEDSNQLVPTVIPQPTEVCTTYTVNVNTSSSGTVTKKFTL